MRSDRDDEGMVVRVMDTTDKEVSTIRHCINNNELEAGGGGEDYKGRKIGARIGRGIIQVEGGMFIAKGEVRAGALRQDSEERVGGREAMKRSMAMRLHRRSRDRRG